MWSIKNTDNDINAVDFVINDSIVKNLYDDEFASDEEESISDEEESAPHDEESASDEEEEIDEDGYIMVNAESTSDEEELTSLDGEFISANDDYHEYHEVNYDGYIGNEYEYVAMNKRVELYYKNHPKEIDDDDDNTDPDIL